MKKLFLALGLLAGSLGATPTRILTIDNGNQIIPDDWDAVTYYSLAPNFKNHFYFDTYSDGSSIGWAFLDIKIGTLVLWWNKPYEAGGLYTTAVARGGPLGYSSGAFATNVVQAWEPKETRLKIPDNKLALGYALPLGESLTLGFCLRVAQLEDLAEAEQRDGAGAPDSYGASLAGLVDGGGGFYPVQGVWKYQQRQAANALNLSPQFSFLAESFTLDAKLDLIWAGLDNRHVEELVSAQGTGTVTQTLKERGTLSWQVQPRLRYMLDEKSSLVLKGYYHKLGFNTEHRRSGSFSGAGFSAIQLAGYDHVDASQDLALDQWEAFLGYLNTWDRGRHSMVLGAGVKGETIASLAKTYQIAASAATYNDLAAARSVQTDTRRLELPLLIGAELGLTPWARARGMVSRNFYANTETQVTDQSFSNTGASSGVQKTRTAGDAIPAWTVAMGFGLNFGSFSWDTALNTGLLGSATGAAFVNPIYQSSFTYGF